jgi:uncharacterized protein (DUF697 family)
VSLSLLKDIRKIYTGLNASEIRRVAAQPVRIGLVATGGAQFRDMEDFLIPRGADGYIRQRAVQMVTRLDKPEDGYNLLICEPGIGLPDNGFLFDPAGDDGEAIKTIASENQEIELALGRNFPAFRPAVAQQMINRISRENAMMALMTALPNVIPSFIELPWAVGEFATDTAFITMNQVRLALMMAAIYERPVGYMEQKGSVAAIAAGAFGWRAVARELAGKIPLGGGLIAKAAIAYAGTWVVGTGLDQAYRTGVGFSRRQRREAWDTAIARGKEIAGRLHA